MSIDPKRFERLWLTCPELQPKRRYFFLCALADGSFMWKSDPKTRMLGPTEHPDSAFAIIRDKIVLVGGPRFQLTLHPPMTGTEWRVYQTDIDPQSKEEGWSHERGRHADPTEACILAVERVLGLPEWSAPDAS